MYLIGLAVRSCYSYGVDRKWAEMADMTTTRSASVSVPIPGGIWVSGGYNSGYKTLETTEMIFLNKTKKIGKPLPRARLGHCMVNYGEKIFSTGGRDRDYVSTTNVWQFETGYNFVNVDGPMMKKTRNYHACGIIHSTLHDSRPILVVAGSWAGGSGAKSSEYWDFTLAGSTWQLCSKSSMFSFIIYH